MTFSTQVNFEFDADEDLLAVDSSLSNEVGLQDWFNSLHPLSWKEFFSWQDSCRFLFCWKLDRFIHILFTVIHSQYSPLPQIQDFPRGRKISPPSPAFRKIGDRLLTKIGRGKGQRFPPALVSSKRGKDGYTFRQVEPILTQLGKYLHKENIYFVKWVYQGSVSFDVNTSHSKLFFLLQNTCASEFFSNYFFNFFLQENGTICQEN